MAGEMSVGRCGDKRKRGKVDRKTVTCRTSLMRRAQLAGNVGDVGLGEVGEASGLDLVAGSDFVFVGKPASAGIFGAVGAET